jgi:hypothetical protein
MEWTLMPMIQQNMVEEGILELRMNRPDRLNALNEELIGDLSGIMRGLNRDPAGTCGGDHRRGQGLLCRRRSEGGPRAQVQSPVPKE